MALCSAERVIESFDQNIGGAAKQLVLAAVPAPRLSIRLDWTSRLLANSTVLLKTQVDVVMHVLVCLEVVYSEKADNKNRHLIQFLF